ncbi:transglycosylase SLT domain-containing protein [Thermosulfuriphilus sp.]
MLRKALLSLFVFIFSLKGPPVIGGQIYYFIDDSGRIHFSNAPTDPRFRPYRPLEADLSLERHIVEVSHRYGLDPELVKAVIEVESNWSKWAISPKGAMGLMQIMPSTANILKLSDPFDPYRNIEAGVRYLKNLYDEFGRWDLALAAYNAGPGRIRRQRGIPPIPETRLYVQRVLKLWRQNRLPK